MHSCRGVVFRMLGLVFAVAVFAVTGPLQASGSRIFAGDAVSVGNGTARVILAANAAGRPTSVSVVLTERALEGLPAADHTHPAWEYVLPMPVDAPMTGYDHVGLDWNPSGHRPHGVYSVPHFDVHFYLVSRAERAAITFTRADAAQRSAPPDASLVPSGYVVPPDTAVEHMGLHGVNPRGPEFRGQSFSHTLIYGYESGRLIFVEPMVSLAYFGTRPDVTVPVAMPAAYSFPGYYPRRYRVGFDAERHEYRVALLGLTSFAGGRKTAQR